MLQFLTKFLQSAQNTLKMGKGQTFLAIACTTTRWCHQFLKAHTQHLSALSKDLGSSKK